VDEKAALIGQIDKAHQEMLDALADVSDDQEIYNLWTTKHLIAHLAGWYDAVNASLKAHLSGRAPATPAARGIDHYNAQTVDERESLPYAHILREWEISLAELKSLVLEVPNERFDDTMVFPWGESGTVTVLVHIFAEHEEEHAADLRRLKSANSP